MQDRSLLFEVINSKLDNMQACLNILDIKQAALVKELWGIEALVNEPAQGQSPEEPHHPFKC